MQKFWLICHRMYELAKVLVNLQNLITPSTVIVNMQKFNYTPQLYLICKKFG